MGSFFVPVETLPRRRIDESIGTAGESAVPHDIGYLMRGQTEKEDEKALPLNIVRRQRGWIAIAHVFNGCFHEGIPENDGVLRDESMFRFVRCSPMRVFRYLM